MGADLIAEHTYTHRVDRTLKDGDQLILARERNGRYALTFDGPDGAEVTVWFDGVIIKRNYVQFSQDGLRTMNLGGQPDNWGDVGEAIQEIAAGNEVSA